MATKNRIVGLTAKPLGYHLLETIRPSPNPPYKRPRPRSPEQIDAPPIGSSDEEVTTPFGSNISSDLSDIDSPPQAKKRKTGRKVRVPKYYANTASVSTEEKSPNPSNGYIAPSNIRPTIFTSRKSSGENNGDNKMLARPGREIEAEEENPFASFESPQLSQSKLRKTYRSSNIHGSAPSPKKAMTKKTTSTTARQGENGFKIPDTKAMITDLNKRSFKGNAAAWRHPPEICSVLSPPSKGSRRSSRNQRKQDSPIDSFQSSQTVPLRPSDLKDQEDHSGFIVPPKLQSPLASPRPTAVFRVPLGDGSSALGLSELFNATEETLTSSGQALEPPSSLVTTSRTSTSNHAASSVSSLSTPPSSPILDAFSESFPIADYRLPTPKAHCPICNVAVPPSLLSSFVREHTSTKHTSHLNMREQELFCRSHRAQSALFEWKSRNYPDIDWINLNIRLERHNHIIEDLLKGRRESFYRNVLEEKVKNGKARTIMQEMNTLSEEAGSDTGYYGSKGAKLMMDHLTTTFSRPLRRLAKTDKLVVSSGGVPAYIQAVLVPELAVALVREDMGVDEEGARAVLRDSADMGELVNEEEEEVLERKESEDEEEQEEGD